METSICQGRGEEKAEKTDAHVELSHNCYRHGHTAPNYEYKNKHIFRYLSLFLIDIAVHFFSSAVLN